MMTCTPSYITGLNCVDMRRLIVYLADCTRCYDQEYQETSGTKPKNSTM